MSKPLVPPPSPVPEACELRAPAALRLPLLVSSPHSGTFLPARTRAAMRVDEDLLRHLDDGPVDRLFLDAPELGGVLLRARYRRAYVDLNRDPLELDPEMTRDLPPGARPRLSLRVRAGLGVVPSRVGTRRLYRRPLDLREIRERLHRVYFPYHRTLAGELERLRRRFGVALLLDVHSMPSSIAGDGRGLVDVCIGDRYGRSAAAELTAFSLDFFRSRGFRVARNRPFAGGYIVERHGDPGREVHALQIEIRRALFVDEASCTPHEGLDQLRAVTAAYLDRIGSFLAARTRLYSVA